MNAPEDAPIQSYSGLAAQYHRERFATPHGRWLFDTDRQIIRDLVDMARPSLVVDVPVGSGRVLEYLRDLDLSVVGVDVTPEMLREAAKVSRGNQWLVAGNAGVLPFAECQADCVISLRFFHLFPRGQRYVFCKEFARIVRPGGHVIVSFTNGWYAGGINWLRSLVGRRTVFFEYPREVARLFPGWKVVRTYGNYLPKQWLLGRIPLLGPALKAATRRSPLNALCWERFYLLQKPDA